MKQATLTIKRDDTEWDVVLTAAGKSWSQGASTLDNLAADDISSLLEGAGYSPLSKKTKEKLSQQLRLINPGSTKVGTLTIDVQKR